MWIAKYTMSLILLYWRLMAKETRPPKEAAILFERIIKASVAGNPKPKPKGKKKKG